MVKTPYLRLADNLDEPKALGFCVDLKGWNPPTFVNAQTHSCKPSSGNAGGGTDEEFEPLDGAVRGRADAAGRCLQAKSATAGAGLDVPTCDSAEALQSFTWDDSAGTLSLGGGGGLCLAAGATLRQANSYWARDLQLSDCATTDAKLLTWRVEGAVEDSAASPSTSAESHNCMTRELWSAEKTTWCCANKQLGCSSPSSLPPPAGPGAGALIAIIAGAVVGTLALAIVAVIVMRRRKPARGRAPAGAGKQATAAEDAA